MLVYESEFAKVEWLDQKKIVVLSQFGHNRGDFLKDSMNKGLEYLIKNKSTKWLSDNREIGFHKAEDTDWINNDWTPRALKSGWRKWALIQPKSAISNLNMRQFIDFFKKHNIDVQVFTDYNEGMSWLELD